MAQRAGHLLCKEGPRPLVEGEEADEGGLGCVRVTDPEESLERLADVEY